MRGSHAKFGGKFASALLLLAALSGFPARGDLSAAAITVAHLNIGHFSGGRNQRVQFTNDVQLTAARERYRRTVAEVGADLWGVSEYSSTFAAVGGRTHATRDVLFGDYPVARLGRNRDGNCNCLFASAAFAKPRFAEADYAVCVQDRYLTEMTAELGGRRVVVAETHLDFNQPKGAKWAMHRDRDGRETRPQQLAQLVDRYRDEPRVILMGDFNVDDGDAEFDVLRKAGFASASGGDRPILLTWSSSRPKVSIDNIFVKGFDILSVRTFGNAGISDHLGLVAKISPHPVSSASAPRAATPDVDALVARMTLEEKIGQVCQENSKSGRVPAVSQDARGETMTERFLARIRRGEIGSIISAPGVANYNAMQKAARESRLGIPLLVGHDLIHTARIAHPIPLAQSCSWDPELCRRIADSIARNGRLLGVNWAFAPMLDIGRDARWGRISEGPGQDPYLASLVAAAQVRGLQGDDPSDGTHLAACAKHFIAYGAVESGRDYNTVEVWDGTLRDIYLPPFAAAVKAGCLTVMPGYHSYNGRPCSMNRYLLTDILRGELGFDGYVISDYGSMNMITRHGTGTSGADIAAKALRAGVDQEMTGDHFRSGLKEAIEGGMVRMGELDTAVRRILSVKKRMGLFENPFIDEAKCERNVDRKTDLALALEAAEKCAVLLKNDGILPLDKSKKVAILGSLADAGLYGCWSGMTTIRGDHLIQYLPQLGYKTKYTKGFTVDTGSASNWHPVTTVDPAAIAAAAKEADVIVAVFGGVDNMSGENMSFADVTLPGRQKEAAKAIIATGKPFVAVLANGRPMAIPELKEHANAILEAWHGGTLASKAIARLLAGEAEPYGRLTVDFPYASGECPVYYNALRTGNPYIIGGTREQNAYRGQYRDTPNEPLFAFGQGLAYTTFAYTNEQAAVKGGEIVCRLDVANTGKRRGSEVVQAYVRLGTAETCRPRRELKGFRRVFLEPGERKAVEIRIPVASLAYHDERRLVQAKGAVTVFLAPHALAGKPIDIRID